MPINTPLINIYEVIIKAIESRKYARRLSIQDHTERENLSMLINVNLSPEQAGADERKKRRNLKVHLTHDRANVCMLIRKSKLRAIASLSVLYFYDNKLSYD